MWRHVSPGWRTFQRSTVEDGMAGSPPSGSDWRQTQMSSFEGCWAWHSEGSGFSPIRTLQNLQTFRHQALTLLRPCSSVTRLPLPDQIRPHCCHFGYKTRQHINWFCKRCRTRWLPSPFPAPSNFVSSSTRKYHGGPALSLVLAEASPRPSGAPPSPEGCRGCWVSKLHRSSRAPVRGCLATSDPGTERV